MTFSSGPTDAMPFVACDPNISAGPETTCGFAENVFLAYYKSWRSQGASAPASTQIQAFSPKTSRTYRVTCVTGAATITAATGGSPVTGGSSPPGGSAAPSDSTVTCSTAEGALIVFPLHAVVIYQPH